jgi:Galactose oxidase, central domain
MVASRPPPERTAPVPRQPGGRDPDALRWGALTVPLVLCVLTLLVLSGAAGPVETVRVVGAGHVLPAPVPPPTPRSPVSARASNPAAGSNFSWAASVPPAAREGAAFAFDGKDRYDVLFGGWNGSAYLGDTWEFATNQWVQLSPAVSPSPRTGATLAYDNADGYVVLFGGWNSGGPLSDTWTFANGTWAHLTLSVHPSARGFAAMGNDTRVGDGYLVLFGGRDTTGTLSDTWKFLHGVWSGFSGGVSFPRGRSSAGLTYDARDGYLVMFGGVNISGAVSTYLSDTWTFMGGFWAPLTPLGAPSARSDFAYVYDPVDGYVVLFGGTDSPTTTAYGDTWTYAGGTWTPVSLASHPSPRTGMEAAWDTGDDYLIAANGATDGLPIGATDSWSYTANNWSVLLSAPLLFGPEPSARAFASTANDTADAAVVLFGGITGLGMNAETWEYATQRWTELFPAVAPSARAYSMMTYDAADGYVLLFGGLGSAGNPLGDSWAFKAGVWTQLLPLPVSPSPRYGAAMTYDATDGEVVLFGGTSGVAYLSDTWAFKGGTWTHMFPGAPPPSPRAFAAITYDGLDHYVLLFGGLNGAPLGDTWTFHRGTWFRLAQTHSPPAAWGGGIDYLPVSGDVVVFGGCSQATTTPTQTSCSSLQGPTMKFYNSKWHSVAVNGSPPFRFGMAHVYDGPDQSLLTFSGWNGSGLLYDRWVFAGTLWTRWFPVVLPGPRAGAAGAYSLRDEHIIVFGGIGPALGGASYFNDTWQWDTGVWAEADPHRSPSPRAWASMAYEPTDRGLVLFGGFGPSGYLADTWIWVGGQYTGAWTQVATSNAPSPRANASITFDPTLNELLLFGGQGASGALSDTWSYHAGVWTLITLVSSPSARASAGLAYDTIDGYDVLFGGINPSTGTVYGDTWTFSAGAWTLRTPVSSPSPRYGFGMEYAYQLARAYNFVLLFGGVSPTHRLLGETWQFVGDNWTQAALGAKGNPVPAAYLTMADDTSDGNPIIFGGSTLGGYLGDFWVYR